MSLLYTRTLTSYTKKTRPVPSTHKDPVYIVHSYSSLIIGIRTDRIVVQQKTKSKSNSTDIGFNFDIYTVVIQSKSKSKSNSKGIDIGSDISIGTDIDTGIDEYRID